MKRSAIFLLLALLLGWTSFAKVRPAYAEVEGDYTYTVSGNDVTITAYSGTATDIIIPATLGGMPVTIIGRSAFDGKGLTSVVIPDSVTTLSTYAFRYDHLSSIDLPDSLTSLGSSAFEGNLLTTVDFPDKVTTIGNYSFYMNNLTSVNFPDSLNMIAGGAFDKNHLVSVVIPKGVTNIQDGVFEENNLTSITLLSGSTSIGSSTFASNPGNLKLFGYANSNVQSYAASKGYAFEDGTSLFEAMANAEQQIIAYVQGTEPGQVPANAYNGLTNALAAARVTVTGITVATVSADLVNAAIPLNAAIQSFIGAVIPADVTALEAAIATANQALADHPQGTGVGGAPASSRSALQAAITNAQAVADNTANLTQVQVNAAEGALNTAMNSFQSTVIPAGNAAALTALLTEANQTKTSHPVGSNVGETSAAAHSAIQTAIGAAQAIVDQAQNQTQGQLDAAVTALNAAVDIFEATIVLAGNSAMLSAAMTTANQTLTAHPAGTNVGETSAAARSDLQTAINAAQAILGNAANQTQAQLDAAVTALNAAVNTFKGTFVLAGDPGALGAALTNANQTLTEHPEGTDVGEASSIDRTSLQAAITVAQGILSAATNQTQAQLDAAVTALNAAVDTFEETIVVAGDAGTLNSALSAANQALTVHPGGTNVGEASSIDRSALQTAINLAQTIADSAANQTQAQLDAAVMALNTAIDIFEETIVEAGDAGALNTALNAANQSLTDHPEGTNVGQTTAEARSDLTTAITAAQAIADHAANQNQAQLDVAVTALNAAVDTFEETIVEAGDAGALKTALVAANQGLTDHPEGTNVGQTTAAARSDLGTAITAAQAIADHAANQNQDQLDAAVTALNAAVDTFEETIVVAGDAGALNTALVAANQALTDHPEGTNVGQTTAGAWSDLTTAITAAQAIADSAANQTQAQLDEAVIALNAAVDTFEETIVVAGDAGALNSTLLAANQALTDHPEGTNAGETSVAARSDLATAITAAQAIADNAANQTQDQLDAAVMALNDAFSHYDTAWIRLVLTVPDNAMYGVNATLRFSVVYASKVIVTGTPTIPLQIGTGSSEQTIYATYTGERGKPLTELSFEYDIPEGLEDVDGIELAAQLELPAGASMTYSDGSAVPLVYQLPDMGGLRIESIPPALNLNVGEGGRTSTEVKALASINGASAGNLLTRLAWLPGSHAVADFAGEAGTDMLDAKKFIAVANGVYTVYARDSVGNEVVKETMVSNIVSHSSDATTVAPTETVMMINGTRMPVSSKTETSGDGQSVLKFFLSSEQVAAAFASDQKMAVFAVDAQGPAVTVSLPVAPLLSVLNGQSEARLQVTVNGSSLQIPLSAIGKFSEGATITVSITQASDAANAELKAAFKKVGATSLIEHPIIFGLDADGQAIEGWDGSPVERTLVLPADVDPDKATAVWIDEMGKLHFAPSIFAKDGSREVKIISLQNGLFTVIQSNETFSDVKGHWAQREIELLANKRIVEGQPDGSFLPNETITRAEFAALLVRALGLPETNDKGNFIDVKAEDWYAGSVGAAHQAGLVGGFENGSFQPNVRITREQMAVMIARALAFARKTPIADEAALASFADGEDIADWAAEATALLVGTGIIQGMTDTTFDPAAEASRAQSAVMLQRMLQYLHYIDA